MKIKVPAIIFESSLRGPCCNITNNGGNILSANSTVCTETCAPSFYTSTEYLSYCLNSPLANPFKLNCSYYDPISLLETTETTAIVSTRIQSKRLVQDPTCVATQSFQGARTANCLPQTQGGATSDTFVADIESHSLSLSFSVFASLGDGNYEFQKSSTMKGSVVDSKGDTVRQWQDTDTRNGDLMSIRDILSVIALLFFFGMISTSFYFF